MDFYLAEALVVVEDSCAKKRTSISEDDCRPVVKTRKWSDQASLFFIWKIAEL